jgi:hypothetical protein
MILEYPNFITAAEKFFKILMRLRWKVLKDREACGFFMVNPSCKDSLMIHRWCYTPKYLAKVMSSADLKDLKKEPAQFKLRQACDIRITGIKCMEAMK